MMKTIIWQQSDVIVDREVESDEIVKIISQNWDKKTVHYICSETAIGKTSLITKVIEKYDKDDCDIIRIKTKPCNDDNGDTAWYYLQELFDGITKYFEKLEEENGYALTFDNFLNEYNDDSVNRTRLASVLETLFGSDSKKGLFKNVCYLALKKILKLNEYSTDQLKNDTSVDSVLVKINYINHVLKNRKVLLIIDNFQNIDNQSLGCFRDTNILLENGTNELEVLEFVIGNNHYGINVAKVKEIVNFQKVTPVPNAHPSVEGIFMPRDTMITVVKLANVLHLPDSDDPKNDMLINTNFNKLNVALHVHKIVGIHRVSWADIITPDATINSAESGIATGIIKVEGRLIIILDFERIVSDISPETGLKVSDISRLGTRDRNNSPIVLAEDSMLLMKLITDSLEKAGYTNLIKCVNGQVAWNYLQNIKKKSGGDVTKYVKCIVTDIEMPIMDGHRLTKLVKTDNELKDIPVIIFSSLINEEMRRKGEQLGADMQLSKPEIGSLVEAIDKLILK